MDKNKPSLTFNARVAAAKRGLKAKTQFSNSTSFYALGTSAGGTSGTAAQSTTQNASSSSSTSLSNKMQPSVKRDTPPSPISKKLKLFQNKPTLLTSTSQSSMGSSSSIFTEQSSWEEKAIEKDPNDLIKLINEGNTKVIRR